MSLSPVNDSSLMRIRSPVLVLLPVEEVGVCQFGTGVVPCTDAVGKFTVGAGAQRKNTL